MSAVRRIVSAAFDRAARLSRHPLVAGARSWSQPAPAPPTANAAPPTANAAPPTANAAPPTAAIDGALFSSFQPEWLSSLSIKGSAEPFKLLPPVEQQIAGTVMTKLDFLPAGVALADLRARDPHPIPLAADREGYYNDRHYDWWLSGLSDYYGIQRALAKWSQLLKAGDRVFELGCASGRVLRHFVCQADGLDVWGADINRRHAEWVTRHLPPTIRMLHSTVFPHLPVEDESVAMVSAFSVFTHIDDLEMAWIAELRRILKPGGIAYLTLMTDHHWRAMGPGWPIYDALLQVKDHVPDFRITPEFLRGPMPFPKTVFWWTLAKVYNLSVFHSTDYVRENWGRYLEVLEIIPRGHAFQDVVILRKNA